MLTPKRFRKERSDPSLRVLLVVRIRTGLEHPTSLWQYWWQRDSSQSGPWIFGATQPNDESPLAAPRRS